MTLPSRASQNVVFSDEISDRTFTDVSSPSYGMSMAASTSASPLIPLRPTKLVLSPGSSSRRGVNWSLKNDFKVFHSSDSIIPSSPVPPFSIRSYLDPDLAYDTPSLSRTTSRIPLSDPPSLVRGILKQKDHLIRIARSVEEGTLNNKEPARRLIAGKRPKLVPRDSFQLAVIKGSAGATSSPKGKARMVDETPGSDESSSSIESDDVGGPGEKDEDGARERTTEDDEGDEQIEGGNGSADIATMVEIILDGAEDLLTLEEAYLALTSQLRRVIPILQTTPLTEAQQNAIRTSTQSIRDEAPAMVRALQRDLQRLMGKVPNSEVSVSDRDSSPFRGLMPLQDGTPVNSRSRLTPSPTPLPMPAANLTKKSADEKPVRQGYTEAEVRYRREASGVGAGALRFLAFTLHTPHLFTCYSDADLQALLEQIMVIPRTPKLPTPNQKRTYFLSILVLAQIRIPAGCVLPVKEKIARAVECAINDNLGSSGLPSTGKEGPSQAKKEGFHAVTNLLSTYPTIFFAYHAELLPPCLRSIVSPITIIRNKAAAAAASFASAKLQLLSDTRLKALSDRDSSSKEEWNRTKVIAQKSENTVITHMNSTLRSGTKSSPAYGQLGERKTEWTALEQVLKDTVTSEVFWACATWSVIVTLIGSAYNSSGTLASGLDHIMDRSLQASNNTTRPVLARIAWNHAIHAYFSNSTSSISDDGDLILSFKPFSSSSSQAVLERCKTIQLPVDLALCMARNNASVTKAIGIVDGKERYMWYRTEKPKRQQWMITCGLSAASVVYAYTGMAIYHKDQPAKEMMAVTGLPSSDGPPVPDFLAEEEKFPRLDNTFEKVVYPMLKSFGRISAVDKLKVHGWEILEAITSTATTSASWDLDRLLSARYLSGEIFTLDKEFFTEDLLMSFLQVSIKPCEIPSWGQLWVAKRLGRLLDLFDEALQGVRGVSSLTSIDWITASGKTVYIPSTLSRVWANLLGALSLARIPGNPPTPLFMTGLQAVTRQLLQVFERDPTTYIPLCLTGPNGYCEEDVDSIRLRTFTHLFNVVRQVLGDEAIGATRIRLDQIAKQAMDTVISQTALGSDGNDHATVVGNLLGQILRTKSMSFPLSSESRILLKTVVGSLLDAGSAQGFSGKLLGDLTNCMPWIFEEDEETQLTVWSSLALKWAEVIDLQPSSANSTPTNHTGALLVNLLSGPFRGRQVTSFWHRMASRGDLSAWQALLKAAVLRSRAKRVGSNLGVLESLAGHLGDFLDQGEKTSSTTITLSCLASAAAWISFVPSEHYHSSHYSINENFVPVDFLTLVADALLEAYPSEESLNVNGAGQAISPAVGDLIESLRTVFEDLPLEFVQPVLEPLKGSLGLWMADQARLVSDPEFGGKLDSLYITLLKVLSESITENHISSSGETLSSLIEIFAPRLSRALSPAVPKAFQDFWKSNFEGVDNLIFSDDVAEFLKDVVRAVPGLINVQGLADAEELSLDESESLYPHSQSFRVESSISKPLVTATPKDVSEDLSSEVTLPSTDAEGTSSSGMNETSVPSSIDIEVPPTQEPQQDNTEQSLPASPALPVPATTEYDADISQSLDSQQEPPVLATVVVDPEETGEPEELVPQSSPRSPQYEKEQAESEGTASPDLGITDVFGPAAMTNVRRKRGKRARASVEAQSLPETKRTKVNKITSSRSMPEGLVVGRDGDDTVEECIVVYESPPRTISQARLPTRSSKPTPAIDTLIVEAGPSTDANVRANRSSLLSSAGRWLSKVPSFGGFFSPSRSTFEEVQGDQKVEVQGDQKVSPPSQEINTSGSERSARKARRAKRVVEQQQQSRAGSEISSSRASSASSKKRMIPFVEVRESRSSKRRRKDSKVTSTSVHAEVKRELEVEMIPTSGNDEDNEVEEQEDELLLSPESARNLRREEEAEIVAGAAGTSNVTSNEESPLASRVPAKTPIAALGTSKPTPSPFQRTSGQSRLLSLLTEATELSSAIEGMDLDGLTSLLDDIEELRSAATRGLLTKAAEGRRAKKARND